MKFLIPLLLITGLTIGIYQWRNSSDNSLSDAAFEQFFKTPPPPLSGPLNVYHLGHSLVGRDMPAMLAQLAGKGHTYESQLGWGTSLKAHWKQDTPIAGFEESNAGSEYRDARQAVASGDYAALILTESVEIRDAIKYSNSARYLYEWARAARAGNANVRVYFYETWPELDDSKGWLARLDRDLKLYWEDEILRRALSYDDVEQPIYMIPAGQVMARFVRKVEASGGIGPIKSRNDLFSDNIHFNDLGAYLVALTHYAVLYQKSPVGLPYALNRADGSAATDPGPEAAALMQEIVWQVVTTYSRTGVPVGN